MEFLTILFSMAMLVWMIPIVQSSRVFVIALLVLAMGTVLGPEFFAVDGPVQISLDRLLWGVMFVLVAVEWRRGNLVLPRLTRMDWLVLGLVAWFFVSALRGGPEPTGSSPVARWLFYVFMPASMYFLPRLVSVHRVDAKWLLYGMVGLGLYLAVTAVLEVRGLHAFVFPRFITDPDIWEFYGRGRGPLLNPSGNGILISMGLVSAIIAMLRASAREKVVWCLVILVLMAGIHATLTRSAWLGAACALAMLGLFYLPRWVRVLGLISVVVLGGLLVSGLKDQLIRMKRDKNLSAADAEKSVQLRPLLAVIAWEMFQDHPLIGHGYGHYFEHNEPYHSDRSYGIPLEQARTYAQHNVLLSVLVDTGLVGLAMFTGILSIFAGMAWQLIRRRVEYPEERWIGLLALGGLVAYLCNGMFQDVMIIPMVHMFLFFMVGVACNVYQHGLSSRPFTRTVSQPSPSLATANV